MSEEIMKLTDELEKLQTCFNRVKEITEKVKVEDLSQEELENLVEEVKYYIKELDDEK
jgi:isopropylmalate/homocitrate/citramalate synthase